MTFGRRPGHEAVAIADARTADVERRYRDHYPGAVDCLLSDFSSLPTYTFRAPR